MFWVHAAEVAFATRVKSLAPLLLSVCHFTHHFVRAAPLPIVGKRPIPISRAAEGPGQAIITFVVRVIEDPLSRFAVTARKLTS
jgi:hypothetical protein